MSKLKATVIAICIAIAGFLYIDIAKDHHKEFVKSEKLTKQNDSLNLVVYQKDIAILKRDSIVISMEKRQAITDSLIVINHKSLKNEKDKIKNFTVESRNRFVDSLLKVANVRK